MSRGVETRLWTAITWENKKETSELGDTSKFESFWKKKNEHFA